MLNKVLCDFDTSSFQAADEFCIKLSQLFGRQVDSKEISSALLTEMQDKFANVH